MATVEGRNVRTNAMFSAILAVLFAIKILVAVCIDTIYLNIVTLVFLSNLRP